MPVRGRGSGEWFVNTSVGLSGSSLPQSALQMWEELLSVVTSPSALCWAARVPGPELAGPRA